LSGRRVEHVGAHFTAVDVQFEPTPVQGHLPIWVAARWPNQRPLRRAARYDGVFIIDVETPSGLAAATDVIRTNRDRGLDAFEVVVELGADQSPEPWERAGATWWLAAFDPFTVTEAEVRARIRRGPNT
jgi:alkanesulfonate monooxygenase SsuD/methylene tetrahydromethanopterin reductase-like flavin-dependent oxidoreductase (luciferase family)